MELKGKRAKAAIVAELEGPLKRGKPQPTEQLQLFSAPAPQPLPPLPDNYRCSCGGKVVFVSYNPELLSEEEKQKLFDHYECDRCGQHFEITAAQAAKLIF